jgi:methylmalonyl-CoA mutase N-terminal domain/subunit
VHLALRTQQIAAYESGAIQVVDPLAGSYYVEDLTDRLAYLIVDELIQVQEVGGALEAITTGYFAKALAENAYAVQRRIETGEDKVVAVNLDRPADADTSTEVFRVRDDHAQHETYQEALARIRTTRDTAAAERALGLVGEAARAGDNTLPALIEAARVRVTLGEMVQELEHVFGRHTPAQIA